MVYFTIRSKVKNWFFTEINGIKLLDLSCIKSYYEFNQHYAEVNAISSL